jgi:hypothetical protein
MKISEKSVKGEERRKLLGKTASNRYLCSGVHDSPEALPHLTAYEMNGTETRKYAPQIA